MVAKRSRLETETALARDVRELATDARRVQNGELSEDLALTDLLRRIERMREQLGQERHGPLRRWLDALQARLERSEVTVGSS